MNLCACQAIRNNHGPLASPQLQNSSSPRQQLFSPQRPALPTLRFFAYTQTLNLFAFSVVPYANEKFGVIFTSSCHLALRALASLPARAWRDSRLHSASENSEPRKRGCCLSGQWLSGLVSLWESVRRLCALRSDTIVQYAACLTSSSRKMKEGWYHSIPITLARQAVHYISF